MMTHMKTLIPRLALALMTCWLLTGADENGCDAQGSAGIDQQTIYTEYDLVYDGKRDRTFVRAAFYIDRRFGKRVELLDGSSVRFEGADASGEAVAGELQLADIDGVEWYEFSTSGMVREGTYTYVNNDGESFSNTIRLPERLSGTALPQDLGPISKSSDFMLSWVGEPLTAQEKIDVIVGDENAANLRFALWSTGADGASSIALETSKWPEEFPIGDRPMMLRRWLDQPVEQAPEAGAVMTSRIEVHGEVRIDD